MGDEERGVPTIGQWTDQLGQTQEMSHIRPAEKDRKKGTSKLDNEKSVHVKAGGL